MTLISKSFKMMSIVALNGAVAAMAVACSTAPEEGTGTTDQAATELDFRRGCAVRAQFATTQASIVYNPMDAAQFLVDTGILAPLGTTGWIKMDVASVGAVYVLQRGDAVTSFYVNRQPVLHYNEIAGIGEWETADGSKLDSFGCENGADNNDNVATATCLNKTPIDQTQFPYVPSRTGVKGACSAKELSDFSAYYKAHASEEGLIASWPTAVSASCAECIFTDDTTTTPASSWGPLVISTDAQGSPTFAVNRGGCIEAVSGKEECGRAYQQYQDCTLQACLTDCKTQAEFTRCRQDAEVLTTSCKGAFQALKDSCGEKDIGKYETACKGTTYTFEGPIKQLCINGAGATP